MNNSSNYLIETNRLMSSFDCPNETLKEQLFTTIPESLINTSINYATLNALKQYLDENQTTNLFAEIISTFLIETQERIDQLEQAIKCLDTKEIMLVAHNLKGISSTLGVVKLASFCNDLENLDSARLSKEANISFEKIQKEFIQVHKIFSLINFISCNSD